MSGNKLHVDLRKFTRLTLRTQDIETSVVEFRFGDPTDDDFASGFIANRTEAGELDWERTAKTVAGGRDIIAMSVEADTSTF